MANGAAPPPVSVGTANPAAPSTPVRAPYNASLYQTPPPAVLSPPVTQPTTAQTGGATAPHANNGVSTAPPIAAPSATANTTGAAPAPASGSAPAASGAGGGAGGGQFQQPAPQHPFPLPHQLAGGAPPQSAPVRSDSPGTRGGRGGGRGGNSPTLANGTLGFGPNSPNPNGSPRGRCVPRLLTPPFSLSRRTDSLLCVMIMVLLAVARLFAVAVAVVVVGAASAWPVVHRMVLVLTRSSDIRI